MKVSLAEQVLERILVALGPKLSKEAQIVFQFLLDWRTVILVLEFGFDHNGLSTA